MITATISNINEVFGSLLTLSCTSEGSPPDTFTWRKDGIPITESIDIVRINHTDTSAVFRTNYMIRRFTFSDIGIYTCRVRNPIGSDDHSINVTTNSGKYRVVEGINNLKINNLILWTTYFGTYTYFAWHQNQIVKLNDCFLKPS